LPSREPEISHLQREGSLRKNGFVLVSQSGSHQKWRHENGRQVIVAMHGSKPIPIGTLKSIVEGSGLDVEDFR